MVKLTYSQKYFHGTREELLEKIQTKMSVHRFAHVQGVEQAAIKLAELNGADVEQASVAALCHDYAKERPDDEMLALIRKNKLNPLLLEYGNAVWHGMAGYLLVESELGITNEPILTAIKEHTVGGNAMSLLSKIIYVADYIEPGRDFPGVEEARTIAYHNLDEGAIFETIQTLTFLISKHQVIYPQTFATYNALIKKEKMNEQ